MILGQIPQDKGNESTDIDLLAEFESEMSLFDIIKVKQELEDLLCNPVDLMTPQALSPHFRINVVNEVEIIYEV